MLVTRLTSLSTRFVTHVTSLSTRFVTHVNSLSTRFVTHVTVLSPTCFAVFRTALQRCRYGHLAHLLVYPLACLLTWLPVRFPFGPFVCMLFVFVRLSDCVFVGSLFLSLFMFAFFVFPWLSLSFLGFPLLSLRFICVPLLAFRLRA